MDISQAQCLVQNLVQNINPKDKNHTFATGIYFRPAAAAVTFLC